MRMTFRLTAIGLIALLAACSSINPFARKAPPSQVPASLQDVQQTMAMRTIWTSSVGSAGVYSFTPALAYGSVFAAAADGSISRISASNGQTEWRINAGLPLTAGVGSDGNIVAVAGEKGVVLAYDSDGEFLWKAQASSEVLSAPAVGSGMVVVRSIDNRIAAYDAESGKRVWSVKRTTPALTLRSAPGLVIVGPTVVAALPGGKLLSIMLASGGVRWEIAVGEPRGATEIERIADVSGYPAVYGRDVCAASFQGRVGCADVVTGKSRWARKLSSKVGPAIDERFVFAVDEKGAVYALDRESGQSVWRNEKLTYRGLSTPVSIGRAVAVADYQGYVHFLSREDGSFLARVDTDRSAIVTVPVIAENKLIYQTKDGTLVAIGAN